MAAFPDIVSSVPALEPLNEMIEFKTLESNFDDLGEEKSRQKWLYPKRSFPLAYKGLAIADAQTLWEFFIARKGKHESFSFFYPFSRTYSGEYVGTGNGVTTVWNLPSKTASSYTLKLDGVSLSHGTDWTFGSGTGADGADKATLVTAPNLGQRITFDFTGILKVRAKFAEDVFDFKTFYNLLATTGVKIRGLLNSTWSAS